MESSEEEALFETYPYTAVYVVQSPTTVSFHSPAATQQHRLMSTLSRYSSSSRGSNNSFLHVVPHDHHHMSVGHHKCSSCDLVSVHGICGGEEEEEEERNLGVMKGDVGINEKKMWKNFVSFSESDSCVWIMFQISLRVMVSFGVALLFFYLITNPPSPVVSLKIGRLNEFLLGEGVDNTGVTTKFLTCNCSINLHVNIKSRLYGLHIHPVVLAMSFNNIPFATSIETRALYASSNGPTSFLLYTGITNKPMYGAGRSMQDILDSGKGLSLVIHVKLRSTYHVVGKLIRPKYHYRAECNLIIKKTYDKQHKTLKYDDQCNML